ncbi:MAG: YqeG family HAD IIIA-type phosphatase [Oscillospiraceae bacterium]|jgi:HAD superfamily phosphatase (TIGR01668 family)
MSVFMPDYIVSSILDVTPEFLIQKGISVVLLDVDNTLAVYGKPEPANGVPEWIQVMQKAGISMIIVSNNTKQRVAPFAEKLGLPYVCMGCKPLGYGIRKARRKMGAARKSTAMIGDQIMTDVIGGNLQRILTILVEPFELETSRFFRWKRRWEQKYIARYREKEVKK